MAKAGLAFGISLIGSLAIPFRSLCLILSYTLAVVMNKTDVSLGGRVPVVCSRV